MRAQPSTTRVPQVFVDEAAAPALTSRLSSMVIHVVDGRATAEVGVVGSLNPELPHLHTQQTRLEIEIPPTGTAFSGMLTDVERRMHSDAPPSTVLHARGLAPDETSNPSVALRFGSEIVSGSVRRSADGLVARCVATTLELRHGSRVTLTTGDSAFDGDFEVTEIWHRFDLQGGAQVEFVARG